MKILLLALNHAPEQTGIGKYQGEMASWLAARGHLVTAITAPPYYPEWKIGKGYGSRLYRKEKIDGVTIIRVPLYIPARPTGTKRILHLLSFVLAATPVLLWKAVREKPDALLLTAPPLMAAPVAWLAARLAKARNYLHIQDFEIDAAFQLGLLKNPFLYKQALHLERLALRTFTAVSTISPNMRRKLIEKGVPENKTALIPNWANTEMFSLPPSVEHWNATLRKSPQTILALYSGNLGHKQGLETIVQAARILSDNNKHIRFVISGDGVGRKDMIAAADGLTNIIFLPVQPQESFVQLMAAADIHLLPQKKGAADLVMPSKLGNILASSRPLIAGADPGTQIYEAVQGCGYTVEPENAVLLAKAIEKLASNPSLRAQMGQAGRLRAKEEWSKDSLLSKMETFLQSGQN